MIGYFSASCNWSSSKLILAYLSYIKSICGRHRSKCRDKLGLRVPILLKSVLTVVVVLITLSSLVSPALIHTRLLAQSSPDFSSEYSSGDVQVLPTSLAWYTWININGTHTIFLALHSTQYPSPVSAFVGESYNTSTNARVFVANAIMAIEAYNDTDGNGILDANYAAGQTELLWTIMMNASQTFTPTPVTKTSVNNVPHYRWGVTYGSVQAILLKNATGVAGSPYSGGLPVSYLNIDHFTLAYDYSIAGNATFLKTSYEIGNMTLAPPTSPNVTLKGLSLSLLHFTLAVSSSPYLVTANTSPYNSQTNSTTSKVNVAKVSIANSLAYEFLFNDNYTLLTNPPVSLRTVYAAVPSNSLPTGALQGSGTQDIIRVQDYVRAALPSIAGLPSSSDLNVNTSRLMYRISYPTWGGIGLKHDPTYVAYYVPHLLTVSTPVPGFPMIIIYVAAGLAVAVTASAVLIVKRTRKNPARRKSTRIRSSASNYFSHQHHSVARAERTEWTES